MNNITKSRLLSTVVIVLLLANIATLTMFWLQRKKEKLPPPRQQGAGPFAFLVKELAMDSTQVATYKTIREEHQKNVEAYRAEIRKAKDALFALLKEPVTNETNLQNALNEVGEKEKAFDSVVFLHFQRVRALCTETQKKKFDEIIQQAMSMMPSGPQRHGPPPPRGDGKRGEDPPMDGDGQRPPHPDDRDDNRPPPAQDGNHPPR